MGGGGATTYFFLLEEAGVEREDLAVGVLEEDFALGGGVSVQGVLFVGVGVRAGDAGEVVWKRGLVGGVKVEWAYLWWFFRRIPLQ